MFDRDFFSNSLQVPIVNLAKLDADRFDPELLKWTAVHRQVFGVDDVRPRQGEFSLPWPTSSRFPVPDLEQVIDLSLSDLLDRRACEIGQIAQSQDKKIVVMWSGGIDSTAVLAALIRNLSPHDRSRITVCTSLAAVDENAFFYHTQIQDRLSMLHWYDLKLSDEFFNRNILLHGDPGDCIFGPSVSKYRSLWPDQQYLKPWKDNLPTLYRLYHDPQVPEFGQWWVDKICANLHAQQESGCMINVKTISDWHWYNYFTFKWQGAITRPFVRHKRHPQEAISEDHIKQYFDLTFFADKSLQAWSYQNLPYLLGTGIQDHKRLVKDYIYQLDGNEHYRDNKRKVNSWVPIYHAPTVVDHRAVHHDYSDPGLLETFQQMMYRR